MLGLLHHFLLALGLCSLVSSTVSDAASTRVGTWSEHDMVVTLAPQLSSNATIVFPSQPQWNAVTERWTKYEAPTFRASVQVATEQDVSAVIKYAISRNVPFFTQNGGHAFNSLTVVHEAIMIQMRKLNSIHIDQATGIATIGGGVIYQELINATYATGREITVGSCPCVGFVGAGLGGGIGRLQGLHGLSQDAFRQLRLVLANGTLIDVSKTQNADLWWAMRGAGHNFGVVVEVMVQTFPQASSGLFHNTDITLRPEQLETGLAVMNKQIPGMPAELAVEVQFVVQPVTLDLVLGINLVYAGNRTRARKWSDPWKALGPLNFTESVVNWRDLPTKSDGGSKEIDCLNWGQKDIYSTNLKTFDIPTMRATFDSFGALIKKFPNANYSTILFEVYSQQGVQASPVEDSAFPNREAMNILPLIFGWWDELEISDAMDAWLSKARAAMSATSEYGRLYQYLNYAKAGDSLESYYGYEPWRLRRLQDLKRKYDPDNQFSGYHSIPVMGAR